MLSPEDQQLQICLLKSNLEEISNNLISQRSSLPELDSENEKKYQETLAVLQVARTLNEEMERLKLENIRLTAKRLQLKNQCEDIIKCINEACKSRSELENILKEEDKEIDLQIQKYEGSLREKADRFRRTRNVYNETEMRNEYEIINQNIIKLELERKREESTMEQLKKELNSLVPNVPEDILAIVGKSELDDKLKELTDKCENLRKLTAVPLQ